MERDRERERLEERPMPAYRESFSCGECFYRRTVAGHAGEVVQRMNEIVKEHKAECVGRSE